MRLVVTGREPMWMDDLFEDFFQDSRSVKIPPVDIYQTPTSYVLEAEAAGYSEDDIKVYVRDNMITIQSQESWKDKIRKARQERHMLTSEIRLPEFKRSFNLPKDSDPENISATFTNGILTLTIPRLRKSEPGRVEVQISK